MLLPFVLDILINNLITFKVVDQYQEEENRINIRWYSLFLLTPLILINWVRNLKYLAPLSSIANAVTIFSFGLIFYYMFESVPEIETRQAVAPFKRLPLFFGTVLFAMEAVGVVSMIVYFLIIIIIFNLSIKR